MSVGIFTEKKHQPTNAEVQAALGARLPLWEAMLAYVRAAYPAEEDFRFLYGKNYGWAIRFRAKSKLVTSLFPAQESFKVQINLSPEAVEQALAWELGPNARQAIEGAFPYPEGRWVFVPVESEQDAEDVRRLLALRMTTKRH